MKTIIQIILIALVAFFYQSVVSGIRIEGWLTTFVVAIIVAILNNYIRPLMSTFKIKDSRLIMGLLLFISILLILMLIEKIGLGIMFSGFGSAVLFSAMLTIIVLSLNPLLQKFTIVKVNELKFINMDKKQIGIIILIIGIAVIIVSQTVEFKTIRREATDFGNAYFQFEEENKSLKNTVLFSGIALLVGGGILLAGGLAKKSD
jgi:putative membrane protein